MTSPRDKPITQPSWFLHAQADSEAASIPQILVSLSVPTHCEYDASLSAVIFTLTRFSSRMFERRARRRCDAVRAGVDPCAGRVYRLLMGDRTLEPLRFSLRTRGCNGWARGVTLSLQPA